jgi:aminotransferase in exopolysaccharide biosynthesis
MFDSIVRFVREHYRSNAVIPLHAPVFQGREREYLNRTIDSTFVSSVGEYVDQFERQMAAYVGSPRAVATMNGTAALHVALLIGGVRPGDLVITQPLTFVATCNAISYCGAEPVFVDVDMHTLGLSPAALEAWLEQHARIEEDGICRLKNGRRAIRAIVPMHTFGHPVDVEGLLAVCRRWHLAMIEDAAESLGSLYRGRHTGTFGALGALSFNGNKILTTGGGGMVLADDELGSRAKYLTTTAKRPHPYEFIHDEIGFNYRLPNLNAALGCAQLEQLDGFLAAKRALAARYAELLHGSDLRYFCEPAQCRSNYWLNAVICTDLRQRDELLKVTNESGVTTRPIWRLMHHLPAFSDCLRGELPNAEWLEVRVVNLPSSVPPGPGQEPPHGSD